MNQFEIIHQFNKEHRLKFCEDIFTRTDAETIDAIKKVILSCERNRFFTIKVESFEIIDDYETIQNMLYEYEENLSKGKSKPKKRENTYAYIDLKDSDVILLVVNYLIAIGDDRERIRAYIAIPRIIDKYYFRIGGNLYSAMYQVVDGSTYNNTNSNSKTQNVTFKTIFMPTRVYRESYNLKTTGGEEVKGVMFKARVFSKTIPAIKYIMAKFGWYDGLSFMKSPFITLSDHDCEDPNCYTFLTKNKKIYVSVPRYLFDNNPVVQTCVYTIVTNRAITKDTTYNDLYTANFWLCSLGQEFNNLSVEKGMSILDSFEQIYDIITKETLRLDEHEKSTMYHVLRWIIGEFSRLRVKDNLDLSLKRIRYAEYIASLYATKLSKGIYRVSDLGKKAKIDSIKKAILISPLYLLGAISKCRLVNYRNLVSDMDTLTAMKCTYKGIAGIGETNSSSVPDEYCAVQISHLGRMDLDASSASDPGLSGTLCPLNKLHDHRYFSNYQEPNFWQNEVNKILDSYRDMLGLKQVLTFRNDILKEDNSERMTMLEDDINTMRKLIAPIKKYNEFEERNVMPLEESGLIQFESEG